MRLSSLTYAYDNSDNITQIADTLDASKTRSFGYDPVERLTRMDGTVGSFAREDYLHDDNGNRLSVERRATVASASGASICFDHRGFGRTRWYWYVGGHYVKTLGFGIFGTSFCIGTAA